MAYFFHEIASPTPTLPLMRYLLAPCQSMALIQGSASCSPNHIFGWRSTTRFHYSKQFSYSRSTRRLSFRIEKCTQLPKPRAHQILKNAYLSRADIYAFHHNDTRRSSGDCKEQPRRTSALLPYLFSYPRHPPPLLTYGIHGSFAGMIVDYCKNAPRCLRYPHGWKPAGGNIWRMACSRSPPLQRYSSI